MKKYFFICTILISLVFVSCTKVIDIDLNTEDPQYVIEGFVTKGDSIHQVTITRTLNFDESVDFPAVDNAIVVISDNLGNAETLALLAPGIYKTSNLLGVEGRTYTITVTVDGKVFTAASTLPNAVDFSGLEIIIFPFGLDTLRGLIPGRIDQAGVVNYYQFDIFQNGKQIFGINLQDDQFSDGVENKQPLFGPAFIPGDTARIIQYCIDKPVYKYLFTIDANTGSTAAPANPESNFGKSCLGYFSARTKQEQTIIIPQ